MRRVGIAVTSSSLFLASCAEDASPQASGPHNTAGSSSASGAGGAVASGGSLNVGGTSAGGASLSGGSSLGGSIGSSAGGSSSGANTSARGGAAAGGDTPQGGLAASSGGSANGGNANGGDTNGGNTNGGSTNSGGGNSGGANSGGAGSAGVTGGPPAGGSSGGVPGGGGVAGSSSTAGRGGSMPAMAGAAGESPALTIASDTSSIEFTPALVAAEDFYPGQARVVSGGIVKLLSDSSVDLGTNAETQSLRQFATKPNLRIIFTVTETFYRIVANKQAGISTLADLKGKRIGTIPNTSAAYYVQKYLSTVGLTEQDYSVVSGSICISTPCGANTFPSLLANGSVDAVALWEPSTELAAEALGDNAIIFQNKTLYREIVNLHSTTEKLADPSKRAAIVEFVRALSKAQALYRSEPERVWPRIAEAIKISPSVLEAVWPDERFQGTLVPDLLDVLTEEEPWVARQGNRTVLTRTELMSLVDTSILSEALGSAP